jgi:hypothetical protein
MQRRVTELLLLAGLFAVATAAAAGQEPIIHGRYSHYRPQYTSSFGTYPPGYTILSPSPGAYPYVAELYYPSAFRYYPNIDYAIGTSYPVPPRHDPRGSHAVHLRPYWYLYP